MQLLELTLDEPAENLALEDALLEEAESGARSAELLRLWEMSRPAVVIGRSSRWDVEVNRRACEARGFPVLRRSSGGAAIIAGPGCLMYSVLLSYERRPVLRAISNAHEFVLGALVASLRRVGVEAAHCGTSDLAIGDQKFSGNSLRCKREWLLYHGTLLYNFPLDMVAACLGTPPRQPDYRAGRDHAAFMTNVPLPRDVLRTCVIDAFDARETIDEWPRERTARLLRQRHLAPDWIHAGRLSAPGEPVEGGGDAGGR